MRFGFSHYLCIIKFETMIRITNTIDELTHEEFIFTEFDMENTVNHNLILDSYYLMKKESKRHKPKIVNSYNRLNSRDHNMTEDQVVLNNYIKTQAYNEYISKIRVIKWSERNK